MRGGLATGCTTYTPNPARQLNHNRAHRQQKAPGGTGPAGAKGFWREPNAYLANTNFATCDLARAAAFLWTTPDLVALSMAET